MKQKLEAAEKMVSKASGEIKWLKMAVYGRNGKGKTYFGATGPKPLVIACNEPMDSIRGTDANIFWVNTWTDIDLAYYYAKREVQRGNVQTVVIDTLTSLAALGMKFVLGDEASRDPTLDPQMPQRPHWFKLAELMKTEVWKFGALPCHVIFLVQERRGFSDDDSDESPEVYPDLSNSPRQVLQAYVTIIGRVYNKEVRVRKKGGGSTTTTEFYMRVAPHEIYTAKVNIRNHGLPRIIKNPTIPKILSRINETRRSK